MRVGCGLEVCVIVSVERLQKVLAAAGHGSRRACEGLIEEGRVAVNGRVVKELPVLVDPAHDRIVVDGEPVEAQHKVYFLLHKPKGVVCTNNDPAGRPRAIDLLPPRRERVFTVGRLDADSTGLLLLTNDGELTARLTHPRYEVPKTYRAEVAGRLDEATLERVRRGVWLSEGKTAPAQATIIYRRPQSTIVEITLREGKNREIRRVLAKLGHKVYRLHRIRIGPLSLGSLPLGAVRPLQPRELAHLKRLAEGGGAPEPGLAEESVRRPSPMMLGRGSTPRRPIRFAGGRSARGPKPSRAARGRPPRRRGS